MRVFADTNVITYAFIEDSRNATAIKIIRGAPVISVQILNEFTNVARRKLKFDWLRVDLAVSRIVKSSLVVVPLSLELHNEGRRLSERYKLSVYDGFVAAAALSAGCDELLSEDLHDGLNIERRMKVRNPFA